LTEADEDSERGKYSRPPFGRRLIVSSCFFLGGFLLSLRGWQNLDNRRRLLSTTLIGCGLLLSASGLILLLLTGFRSTWNWWL